MGYITKLEVVPHIEEYKTDSVCTVNVYFENPETDIERSMRSILKMIEVVSNFHYLGSGDYFMPLSPYIEVLDHFSEARRGNPWYTTKVKNGICMPTNVPSVASVWLQKHLDKHFEEIVNP